VKLTSGVFLTGRHLPFLESDGSGGGGGAEGTGPDAEQKPEAKDDQNADEAIKKELRNRANKLQEERDALLREKQQREDADKKRREKEAEEAGKFQELATQREKERDDAIQERDALKAENQKLRDTMQAGVQEQWKALPDEVRKVGEKAHPDDDIHGRYAFLTDPDTKALVARITGDGGERRRDGNGPNPPPRVGQGTGDDTDIRNRNARRYG